MSEENHAHTRPVTVRRRYPDAPLVGVAAVVFNVAGEVLLVQRARPPRQGQWGLPGGLIDLGETLLDGVRREVREECGIEVEVGDLVAVFEPIHRDNAGEIEYHYVVVDYWARHVQGDLRASDDAMNAAWVAFIDLDSYALLADTRRVIEQAWKMAEERDSSEK
jgi:8-oxo-dGTP diphosphatase